MAECIERAVAVKVVLRERKPTNSVAQNRMLSIIQRDLLTMPAADVAPVVHARWIRPHWRNSNYCCDCSECGGEAMHRDYQWDKNGIYPICPNCGAKMDGGAEDG